MTQAPVTETRHATPAMEGLLVISWALVVFGLFGIVTGLFFGGAVAASALLISGCVLLAGGVISGAIRVAARAIIAG